VARKVGGPNDKGMKKVIKRDRKLADDHYRRARYNHQSPRTGKYRREPKKQGCITMTALLVLAAGSGVTAVILTVRGIA